MVDLSGGQDGPLEHAFSNSVFILPGIVVVGLSARYFEPLSVETQLWVREHVDMAEEGLNINQIQQLLDEGKIPSKKALMDMLETADVEEELKENLRGMLMGDVPQVFGAYSTTLGVVFVFLICLKTMAADTLNIGELIKEKLAESFEGPDVMSTLQNLLANSGHQTGELKDKLTGIMDHYNTLSDGDKLVFGKFVKELLTNKLAKHLKDNPPDLSEVEEALTGAVRQQLIYAAIIGVAFLILIVFFGYKLYKSIKEKDLKREEKRKAKLMKKKK
ncbi:unnamed protein product [Leptidea sinapis]|uniref:Uncharacterized protein n=1 Tax=Leptidea sinapis TaxID=189913 RepID=A0A5E4R6Y5_9NEOP|nr:unnamed protein product [Leptidea sinapis]